MWSNRYSYRILVKFEFSVHSFEKSRTSIFMKIRWVEAELFHADGQTDGCTDDGQTDMTKLIVAFRSFKDVSKKTLPTRIHGVTTKKAGTWVFENMCT
jgi:hypothetical protein